MQNVLIISFNDDYIIAIILLAINYYYLIIGNMLLPSIFCYAKEHNVITMEMGCVHIIYIDLILIEEKGEKFP